MWSSNLIKLWRKSSQIVLRVLTMTRWHRPGDIWSWLTFLIFTHDGSPAARFLFLLGSLDSLSLAESMTNDHLALKNKIFLAHFWFLQNKTQTSACFFVFLASERPNDALTQQRATLNIWFEFNLTRIESPNWESKFKEGKVSAR